MGVAQGRVLSPLVFSLFINALSRYLTSIGRRGKIGHGIPNIAIQTLMDLVQEFEAWCGIQVTGKTKQMTVDDITANRLPEEIVTYKNSPVCVNPEIE